MPTSVNNSTLYLLFWAITLTALLIGAGLLAKKKIATNNTYYENDFSNSKFLASSIDWIIYKDFRIVVAVIAIFIFGFFLNNMQGIFSDKNLNSSDTQDSERVEQINNNKSDNSDKSISEQKSESKGQAHASFIASIIIYIFPFFLLIFYLTLNKSQPIPEIFGLGNGKLVKIIIMSFIFFIVATSLIYFFNGVVIVKLLNWLGVENQMQESVKILKDKNDKALMLSIAISAGFIAPIAEEFIFRGYLYPVMKKYVPRFYAIITISIFFGLVHVNSASFLALSLFSVILIISYEYSKNILMPVLIHAFFNFNTIFFIFYETFSAK